MEKPRTLIKIKKEAKDTTIANCDFEGECTHIDNEGQKTKLINNKHRAGKGPSHSNQDNLKITD